MPKPISKEILLSRRENSLTIRFLAQCLCNDLIFSEQQGIHRLMSMAKNGMGDSNLFSQNTSWEYWFLFHLEDFGSADKSEIDILLRSGDTLLPIEVKAFTNPNDTNVKREIVRNYLTLEKISQNSQFFDPVSEIIPVLLYSKKVHFAYNRSAKTFNRNYFNKDFLCRKGYHQEQEMEVWNCKSFPIRFFENYSFAQQKAKVSEISRKLIYLTWDDVLSTIQLLNSDGKFNLVIDELTSKIDTFGKNKTRLISSS